jgi:hypothetical protein
MDEEVDGAGGKWSGDTTTVDVQTPLEVFLNMSLRSAGFTDGACLLASPPPVKNQNFWSWDYQVLDYQDF